jgi:uracil-DNA glycosylase
MDASRLQNSLLQILENYRRSGVARFERLSAQEMPAELIEKVNAITSNPTVAQTAATEAMRPAAQPPSRPPNDVSAVETASKPVAAVAGAWSLPVLEPRDRQHRLSDLNERVRACRHCVDIVGFRQQTVFGSGPLRPIVCFMGEAPGADEDRTGEPFVGKAGQLLTKIITATKLSRDEVYILNALKCRPPQNRTPMPDEISGCRQFVESQLEILQPKYIVCLGAVAVQSILQTTTPIGRLRGRFHDYRGARVVVTYHPSYLLRQESAKRLVWEDMQMLMSELGLLK